MDMKIVSFLGFDAGGAVVIGILVTILALMAGALLWYYRLSRRQLKELEQARREAMIANNAKNEFLSSMSHDIRTPMNAIIGMTEIALKDTKDIIRVEECLHKIKLSSKHLVGLMDDLLDMSKIENHKMTLSTAPVSLKEIVSDAVTIMQPQVKARDQYFDVFIQNIIAEEVHCDGIRLSQILLILLSNAAKFTPAQGQVTMRVWQEASPKGEEYVRTHFEVEDSGIGMSEEFQEKIFDSFSREETEQVNKTSGAGLGMAITKSIVALMEGTIELQSRKGEGTAFHITIDFRKAAVSEEETDESTLDGKKILLAEDIEINWEVAEALLGEFGLELEWAVNGKECVEKFAASEIGYYDAVLMDIRMPIMNGYEATREIRALGREDSSLPIIAMTADAFSGDVQRSLENGMNAHIAKPIDVKECIRTLKKHIR